MQDRWNVFFLICKTKQNKQEAKKADMKYRFKIQVCWYFGHSVSAYHDTHMHPLRNLATHFFFLVRSNMWSQYTVCHKKWKVWDVIDWCFYFLFLHGWNSFFVASLFALITLLFFLVSMCEFAYLFFVWTWKWKVRD